MKVWCFLICAVISAPALGHSGRTNSEGCHHDRKNGGYHCHNGGSARAATPRVSAQPASALVPVRPTSGSVRPGSIRTEMEFYHCVQHIQYLASRQLVVALSKNTSTEYEAVLKDQKRITCQASHHQVITPGG